jgi:hypothetical protein
MDRWLHRDSPEDLKAAYREAYDSFLDWCSRHPELAFDNFQRGSWNAGEVLVARLTVRYEKAYAVRETSEGSATGEPDWPPPGSGLDDWSLTTGFRPRSKDSAEPTGESSGAMADASSA